MSDAPCGCAKLDEAEKLRAKGEHAGAKSYQELGEELQRTWGCPHGGHEPPHSAADLSQKCRATLARVEKLTGAELHHCPRLCARLEYVHAAGLTARRLKMNRANPGHLSASMLAALDAFDQGQCARMAYDAENPPDPKKKPSR